MFRVDPDGSRDSATGGLISRLCSPMPTLETPTSPQPVQVAQEAKSSQGRPKRVNTERITKVELVAAESKRQRAKGATFPFPETVTEVKRYLGLMIAHLRSPDDLEAEVLGNEPHGKKVS